MRQLAFFMNPSHLSWKIIPWLLDQIFNANHLIFTGYGISALRMSTQSHGIAEKGRLNLEAVSEEEAQHAFGIQISAVARASHGLLA